MKKHPVKKLTPSGYRSMPWKNGAGTTVEIAVFPEYAKLDDFIWRVSRAQVISNGEFSSFAGIDRSLALLRGAGMRLTTNDVVQQADAKNNIVTFAGDAKTHAELMDGAIGDFNLMSRRSVCSHQLTHWTHKETRQLPANTKLLYCAQGSGKLVVKNGIVDLHEDEAIQFSSESEVSESTLQSNSNSRFYCVQIQWNRD